MSNGTAVPATASPAPAPITLRRVRIVGSLIMSISKKREKALRCQHGGSSVVKTRCHSQLFCLTPFREPSSLRSFRESVDIGRKAIFRQIFRMRHLLAMLLCLSRSPIEHISTAIIDCVRHCDVLVQSH